MRTTFGAAGPPGDDPPRDDHLRALTAGLGTAPHPVLYADAWIIVVFARDGRVSACNHYTALDDLFAALDAVAAGGERAQVHVPTPITPAEWAAGMRYVAPARHPYTFAHIRDDDRDPGPGNDGFTACGRELLMDELWVDVPADAVDAVCPGCTAPGGERQAGLWAG